MALHGPSFFAGFPINSIFPRLFTTFTRKHHANRNRQSHEASQLITNGENLKPDAASLPFEAPYPFTAQELWQKILKVVELPQGYVSRQQVESIFDVRLQKLKFPKGSINYHINHRPHPIYIATRGGNWYFDLAIYEQSLGQSIFSFDWGGAQQWYPREFVPYDSSPLPPPGMCLLPDPLMRDVEQRGWIFKPGPDDIHHSPLASKNYIKGKRGFLSLLFFRQEPCLHSVVIYATSDRIEYHDTMR